MSRTNADIKRDTKRWWEIHDKDSYVCPDCGRTQSEHGRQWQVHHINRQAGKVVGLYLSCHKIRHGADPESVDLEFWKTRFLNLGNA